MIRIRDGLTSARVVTVPRGHAPGGDGEAAGGPRRRQRERLPRRRQRHRDVRQHIDADLLSSRPRAATLEGYLYPATYSFPRSSQRHRGRPDDAQRAVRAADAGAAGGSDGPGPSIHQVLILASIVEREVVLPEERAVIASVYRNRLDDGMPLQADPTVQYAMRRGRATWSSSATGSAR